MTIFLSQLYYTHFLKKFNSKSFLLKRDIPPFHVVFYAICEKTILILTEYAFVW